MLDNVNNNDECFFLRTKYEFIISTCLNKYCFWLPIRIVNYTKVLMNNTKRYVMSTNE